MGPLGNLTGASEARRSRCAEGFTLIESLVALSIVAKQAIKPIERAQNESLEELMTAGAEDVPVERIEDAIDAGAARA